MCIFFRGLIARHVRVVSATSMVLLSLFLLVFISSFMIMCKLLLMPSAGLFIYRFLIFLVDKDLFLLFSSLENILSRHYQLRPILCTVQAFSRVQAMPEFFGEDFDFFFIESFYHVMFIIYTLAPFSFPTRTSERLRTTTTTIKKG